MALTGYEPCTNPRLKRLSDASVVASVQRLSDGGVVVGCLTWVGDREIRSFVPNNQPQHRTVQGYLAPEKQPPSLGPLYDVRYIPTVGS